MLKNVKSTPADLERLQFCYIFATAHSTFPHQKVIKCNRTQPFPPRKVIKCNCTQPFPPRKVEKCNCTQQFNILIFNHLN